MNRDPDKGLTKRLAAVFPKIRPKSSLPTFLGARIRASENVCRNGRSSTNLDCC
jgi:hypothetical protein